VEQAEKPKTFRQQLMSAFTYPATGRGPWLLLGWFVAYAFLSFLGFVLSIVPFAGLILVPVVALMIATFICYLTKIIGETARGEDAPPDWPDITCLWEQLLRPLLLMVAAGAVSFGPIGLCNVARFHEVAIPPVVDWSLLMLGLAYFPMALLAVALYESIAGLNPILVVRSIFRVGPSYFTALLIMAWIYFLGWLSMIYVLPYVPMFGGVLSGGVLMYMLMAEMRILGLIYRYHEDRIDWFGAH
jgi:hypothetical protein